MTSKRYNDKKTSKTVERFILRKNKELADDYVEMIEGMYAAELITELAYVQGITFVRDFKTLSSSWYIKPFDENGSSDANASAQRPGIDMLTRNRSSHFLSDDEVQAVINRDDDEFLALKSADDKERDWLITDNKRVIAAFCFDFGLTPTDDGNRVAALSLLNDDELIGLYQTILVALGEYDTDLAVPDYSTHVELVESVNSSLGSLFSQ